MTNTQPSERAGRNRFARLWRMHTTDDRWDMCRYGVTILWAVAFLTFTPAALRPVLVPATTWVPLLIVIAGAVVGIIGRSRNDHLRIELWGALGVVAGYGFYLMLNLLLVFLASPERIQQFLLVFLAMSFAVERLFVLAPRLLAVLRGEDDES